MPSITVVPLRLRHLYCHKCNLLKTNEFSEKTYVFQLSLFLIFVTKNLLAVDYFHYLSLITVSSTSSL